MPSEDREHLFENALAHQLRADASSQPVSGACCDAEILAAYHERSLSTEEMTSVQAHVGECEHCRQILAHLAATDEIPVAVPRPIPEVIPASKPNLRITPAPRRPYWRWVAPAGALAAALLVWVTVHENRSLRLPSPAPQSSVAPMETAKDQPASPPQSTGASIPAARSRETPPSEGVSTPQPALSSPSAPPVETLNSLHSKQKARASAAKKRPAPDDSDLFALNPPEANAADAERDSKTFSHGVANEAVAVESAPLQAATDKMAKAAPEENASRKRDRAASTSPLPPPSPGVAGGAAVAAPAQAAQTQRSATETVEVSDAVIQQQQIAGMSRFDRKAEMRLAKVLAEVTISAPGGRASWRVGPAGFIQFSSDSGKTWAVQPSGVIADLFSGSAPSDQVCWIVGAGGTVLVTTDAGTHWQKVSAPAQVDLRSVFAVNARSATVSSGNDSYQTNDGGATWKKLPPE